jgi:UDP-N-acetylmuramoylalanine--D-glutamate ligase
VVLIGRDALFIADALGRTGIPLRRADSLEQAVNMAFDAAQAGDAVLLSPACASFDMFHNYVHRAEVFCAAVHALAASHAEAVR